MPLPIRTTFRGLDAWFASAPDRFTRERSPRRTIVWGAVILTGVLLSALVLLHRMLVLRLVPGGHQGWSATLGALVLPLTIVAVGTVFEFVWVHRFRVRGGGIIGRTEVYTVPAYLNLCPAFRAFRSGGLDPDGVQAALGFLEANRVDARTPDGCKLVVLTAAPADRLTFIGVLHSDPARRRQMWIRQEPLTLSGLRYFDPRESQLPGDPYPHHGAG